MALQIGDAVQVLKGVHNGERYYQATVIEGPNRSQQVKVSFEQFGPSWDEWVEPSRLRPSAEAVRPSTAAAAHEHTPRRVEHAPHTAHEAPVRFSANRTVSQSYEGLVAEGHAGQMDTIAADITSLRRELSEERKSRLELQERLWALERAGQAEKQEAATAATELREAVEKLEQRMAVDSKTMAHSATQIERLQADARDLATDSSEMQNSIHMVMDMLEGCIDGKEAHEMVKGCMDRIETSESAFKVLVDEAVTSLTDHVDGAEQRTLESTATAIEGIELMEKRLDGHIAEAEASLQQAQEHAQAQLDEASAAMNARLDVQAAALEEARLDAEEKMAQAAAENQSARDAVASEAQAQTAQLAGQLREEGERLRSELGASVEQIHQRTDSLLGSAVANLEGQLEHRAGALTAALGMAESSAAEALGRRAESIEAALAKLGSDHQAVAQALRARSEEIASVLADTQGRIGDEAQSAAAANAAVDEKYAGACEQLRTLLTHMEADHTAQMARAAAEQSAQLSDQAAHLGQQIAATNSELVRASSDSAAALEALKENIGAAMDEMEQKSAQDLASQGEKFGELCMQLGRDIDEKVTATNAKLEKAAAEAQSALDRAQDSLSRQLAEAQDQNKQALEALRESSSQELSVLREEHSRLFAASGKALADHAATAEQHLQRELKRVRSEIEQRATAKLDVALSETHSLISDKVEQSRRQLEQVISEESAVAQARSEEQEAANRSRLDSQRDTLQQRMTQLATAQDERMTEILADMRSDRENFRVTLGSRISDSAESITRSTDAKLQRLENSVTSCEENLGRKQSETDSKLSMAETMLREQLEEKTRNGAEATKRVADQLAKSTTQLTARVESGAKEHAAFKSSASSRLEALGSEIAVVAQDSTDGQASLREQLSQSMEAASVALRRQVETASQHMDQQLREVADSFHTQLSQVEDEAHAVHTTKYTALEAKLTSVAEAQEAFQLVEKQIANRLRALYVLQVLMQKRDTHEVFRRFDADGSGKIERRELQKGLGQLGVKLVDAEAAELMNILDSDNSGSIEYAELVTVGAMGAELDARIGTLGDETRAQADALRTEMGEYGASWKSDLEGVRQKLSTQGAALAEAQSEQKTLAVSIREGVASACERAESVKKQLAARIDAEEAKLKDGLAAAREDAAELRTELSSASTAQIKLAARVSATEDMCARGEEAAAELASSLSRMESSARDVEQRLERVTTDGKRSSDKLSALESKHDTTKSDLLSKLGAAEAARGALGQKIENVDAGCKANATAITTASANAGRALEQAKAGLEATLNGLDSKASKATAERDALRVRMDGSEEKMRAEAEKRMKDLRSSLERTVRERSEKLEIQIESAAAAGRATAESVESAAAALQKQIDDHATTSDGRLQELRSSQTERSSRMEQQLEWYMRYAKTLSTLLGELETKVDGSVRSLQEEQARGREDITQLESELASSTRAAGSGAARTPRFRSERSQRADSDAQEGVPPMGGSSGAAPRLSSV